VIFNNTYFEILAKLMKTGVCLGLLLKNSLFQENIKCFLIQEFTLKDWRSLLFTHMLKY